MRRRIFRRQHRNPDDRLYKLLERIGRGGMGEVWVAEQSEPIRRKVAIKLIRAGMDSRKKMYMPRTLRIEAARTERSLESHAEEILALTKMNWNDTQLDGSLPITIRTARQVGKILRSLRPNDRVPHKYSFYM